MISVTEFQWEIKRVFRRLGVAGVVGLALLVLAVAIFVAGIYPIQRSIESLRHQLSVRPIQAVESVPELTPEQSLLMDLALFGQRFATVDKLSDQLDILFQLTDQHHLTVDKGEYALNERAGGMLRRFEVTLPVSGTYPDIRNFIQQMLEKLPATALSNLELERDKISDGHVKATLHIVIFVSRHA